MFKTKAVVKIKEHLIKIIYDIESIARVIDNTPIISGPNAKVIVVKAILIIFVKSTFR